VLYKAVTPCYMGTDFCTRQHNKIKRNWKKCSCIRKALLTLTTKFLVGNEAPIGHRDCGKVLIGQVPHMSSAVL
jgi:hypothetical protein